jgi:hypothetical protein
MAVTVRVRGAQLRDAGVRLANVERDICVDLSRTAVMMQPFRAPNTSGIRKASSGGGGPDRGGRTRCARHRMPMQRSDVEEAQLVFTEESAIASVLHSKCREEADAASSTCG